jgi:hypothetical protein
MPENYTSSRKALRERNRLRNKRQRLITTSMVISFGIVLMGLGVYYSLGYGSIRSNYVYGSDDVVYDQPIQAVFEVIESPFESVQFLPQDGPQPKIVLVDDFHNFGVVGPTDVVSHEFLIANQGQAPLTISRAYTTCGCTTADFTGTIIPPGKVAIVTMTYDAGFHDARGQTVSRGIIIENNDPKNPQVELWAQVSVRNTP